MSPDELRANPYVGLRPFFIEDSLYFYGRNQQTDELLAILREHRFVSVVGTSGSGKSSLVRAGLLPGLIGGFLVRDRDRWCHVQIKPGDSPISNLAEGLCKAVGAAAGEAALLEQEIRDTHAEAIVRFLAAHIDDRTSVFVLVDQFEEIFSFRRASDSGESEANDVARRLERSRRHVEAADFVDLLLRLAERPELPIYVALTMRTDFLGDCDLFFGLPEALNRGRYLVPRLTREQLRDAVECPALLVGAEMTPRLLDHVLNELGDRGDRLPVLQHALLRTFEEWHNQGRVGPIDLEHYLKAGGLEGALNQDAEGVLKTLDRDAVARVFKRLTDTDISGRQVRSPARVSELQAASGVDRATIDTIVDQFQGGGRSFVFRARDGKPDDPRIDISHESLIRQWQSLSAWVNEERASSEIYEDLLARSRKHEDEKAALLHDPELRLIADWREKERPSEGWARRYSRSADDYTTAIGYLDESISSRSRELAEVELARQWRRRWAPVLIAIVAALFFAGASRVASFLSEGPRAEAATLATTKIRELTWTTSDSHQPLTFDGAKQYCNSLPITWDVVAFGEEPRWRLPSPSELLDIYSPEDTANGFGRKIRKEFHRGVTSDYLWTSEWTSSSRAVVADFKRQLMIDVSPTVGSVATALCVTSNQGRSARSSTQTETKREIERSRFLLIVGLLYIGLTLTLYYGLATLGRRIQRARSFDRLVEMFKQAGGRHPRDAKADTQRDALEVHRTIYASTIRRLVGWTVDSAIYIAFMIAAMLYITAGGEFATIITPDGTEMEGTLTFDPSDPEIAHFTSDEGEQLSFSTRQPPQFELADLGDENRVNATLPAGETTTAFPFARHVVRVKRDDGANWYGTFVETDSDATNVTVRYTAAQWQRTRDEYIADLQWRFGEAPQVAEQTQAWIKDNPPPSNTADLKFPLRGYEIEFQMERPTDGDILKVLALGWLFAWLYESLLVSSKWQATLGMRLLGIMRTDLHGDRLSFGRASALFAYRLGSYLTFSIGLLIQPFSKRRQALHDRLAGSVVLRRPRPGVEYVATPGRLARAVVIASLLVVVPLMLFGLLSSGNYQVAMGYDPQTGAVRWDEVGISMMIDELTMNGQRVTPGMNQSPNITLTSGQPTAATLRSRLEIELPIRCPTGGCPVGFVYGIDSVDAAAFESRVLGSSECEQPVARAAPAIAVQDFESAPSLPPLTAGRYELWFDFRKITSCKDAPLTAADAPTRMPIALIEVK